MDYHTEMVQAICTTNQPRCDQESWIEAKSRIPEAVELRSLAPGVRLVATSKPFSLIARSFRDHPPIFLRHICPANLHLKLTKEPFSAILATMPWIVNQLHRDSVFSVQTRVHGQGGLRRFDVNEHISKALEAAGFNLHVRQPEQVVSVQIAGTDAFIGVSQAADNLSDWAGGECRFRREPGQISRAEFKLLEAIRCFGIELPSAGTAIDLGAAPGGWTRILLHKGLSVVAVDPANMNTRVRDHKRLRYIQSRAQDVLHLLAGTVDILVSDMRMDSVQAAHVICRYAVRLKPTALLVVTLKLPHRNAMQKVQAASGILRRRYDVHGVRQLFHNRNEVTVFGTKW